MEKSWCLLVLSEKDIKWQAEQMGVELTQEEIEKAGNEVKRILSRSDALWDIFWQSVSEAIKRVKSKKP